MSDSKRASNHVRHDDKNVRGGEEGDWEQTSSTQYGTKEMRTCEPANCLHTRSKQIKPLKIRYDLCNRFINWPVTFKPFYKTAK